MKKLNVLLIGLIIFTALSSFITTNAYADINSGIYSSGVFLENVYPICKDGQILINGTSTTDKIKLLIIKDNIKIWKDVNVVNGKYSQKIWLTNGIGSYTIAIMINKFGTTYKYGPKVIVYNEKVVSKYSVSEKDIESENDDIVNLATKITKGKVSDIDKAKAIYEWVSQNISYDYQKYNDQLNLDFSGNYGALNTLKTKKGVCYDYATLIAALGRASGLQVKVIAGNENNNIKSIHNWNEIYIPTQNLWIKADASSYATSKINNFNLDGLFNKFAKISEL